MFLTRDDDPKFVKSVGGRDIWRSTGDVDLNNHHFQIMTFEECEAKKVEAVVKKIERMMIKSEMKRVALRRKMERVALWREMNAAAKSLNYCGPRKGL